jgi:CRISPR-associated protein Cmr5
MPAHRIDQEMAVAAVDALRDVTVTSDLRTRYRQLRIMLHSAGLAASYAFIASKARDPEVGGTAAAYTAVAQGLITRLCTLGLLTGSPADLSVPNVMGQLGRMDPARYTRASAEAAAFVSWVSRLADAIAAAGGEGAA